MRPPSARGDGVVKYACGFCAVRKLKSGRFSIRKKWPVHRHGLRVDEWEQGWITRNPHCAMPSDQCDKEPRGVRVWLREESLE